MELKILAPSVKFVCARKVNDSHHHIGPHLAEGVDQVSIVIVVHLTERGRHTRHKTAL